LKDKRVITIISFQLSQ